MSKHDNKKDIAEKFAETAQPTAQPAMEPPVDTAQAVEATVESAIEKQVEKIEQAGVTKTDVLSMLRDAMRATVEELLPAFGVLMASQQQSSDRARKSAVERHRVLCDECGFDVLGCEKKHVEMAVWPAERVPFLNLFPGVHINGKHLRSLNAGHVLKVPANAQSAIQRQITEWEESEMSMVIGRKAAHHSGGAGMQATGPLKGWS